MPANAAFTFELQGLKELDDMLKQLPKAMGKAVLRKALKAAANPIAEAAKANVPRGATGNLQDSIEISTKLNKNQRRGQIRQKDRVVVYVGSTGPLAHLIEFGTAERARSGSGGATGAMDADPFFTRAWDATKDQALQILTDQTAIELAKAAARLRKRAEKGKVGIKIARAIL